MPAYAQDSPLSIASNLRSPSTLSPHPFRMTHFHDSRHSFPFPLMRHRFPPLSTLCDLMKLPISSSPHRFTAQSSPAFRPDHVPFTHSLIMSGIMHSLTRPRSPRATLYILPATRHGTRHTLGRQGISYLVGGRRR